MVWRCTASKGLEKTVHAVTFALRMGKKMQTTVWKKRRFDCTANKQKLGGALPFVVNKPGGTGKWYGLGNQVLGGLKIVS